MTALLFPQATPIQLSPEVSFIPLIKLRDANNHNFICELYSTYSHGLHWISSIIAHISDNNSSNSSGNFCKIVEVSNHEEPFTEQEVSQYLSAFTKEAIEVAESFGESPMGSFKMVEDTTNDPFELVFQALRVIEETA